MNQKRVNHKNSLDDVKASKKVRYVLFACLPRQTARTNNSLLGLAGARVAVCLLSVLCLLISKKRRKRVFLFSHYKEKSSNCTLEQTNKQTLTINQLPLAAWCARTCWIDDLRLYTMIDWEFYSHKWIQKWVHIKGVYRLMKSRSW